MISLQDCLKGRGESGIAVSTSAVAAKLVKEEKMAHSVIHIPFPCGTAGTCHISVDSNNAQKLLEIFLVIWDGAVICHCHCIEPLHRSLRDIMQNKIQFNEKVFIISADFMKIIPVVQPGSRAHIVSGCAKSSFPNHCFPSFRPSENMSLQSPLRDFAPLEEAVSFYHVSLQVMEEKVSTDHSNYIEVPQYINKVCGIQDLYAYVYN